MQEVQKPSKVKKKGSAGPDQNQTAGGSMKEVFVTKRVENSLYAAGYLNC